jgi:hypothetical protein
MNKRQKLALFLGMLCGDGCLPIKHNGKGYRDYAIQFYNTDKKIMILFSKLFNDLFNLKCKINYTDRSNKQRLFEICKYSKFVFIYLKRLGFPEGVKRDVLRVLECIKKANSKEKLAFILVVLITDGSLRKRGDILFHSGSKLFLEDMTKLIKELINKECMIKEYTQNRICRSFQLNLSKTKVRILFKLSPKISNEILSLLYGLVSK